MTGMMMGAGTDYAVFLFSRYQECLRTGMASDDAVVYALATIGEVIAGSAATVALTFMGLSFATLGVFSDRRARAVGDDHHRVPGGHDVPARPHRAGRPARMGQAAQGHHRAVLAALRRAHRAPAPAHLAASLVILLALAGWCALVKYNYDDRKNTPGGRAEQPRLRRP